MKLYTLLNNNTVTIHTSLEEAVSVAKAYNDKILKDPSFNVEELKGYIGTRLQLHDNGKPANTVDGVRWFMRIQEHEI